MVRRTRLFIPLSAKQWHLISNLTSRNQAELTGTFFILLHSVTNLSNFFVLIIIKDMVSYILLKFAFLIINCSDGDKMAPSVEKKLAELEMGLLHLQQNIDIPEISLPVHPIVANVIKRCADDGSKPKVADFGDRVNDSSFLNQLQNGVNRWIKEIQKVYHTILLYYCGDGGSMSSAKNIILIIIY